MENVKGSWVYSARNINFNGRTLKAELKKTDREWVYHKIKVNPKLFYENINGQFVGKPLDQMPIMPVSKNELKVIFSNLEFGHHGKQLGHISNVKIVKFRQIDQLIKDAQGMGLIFPMNYDAIRLVSKNRSLLKKNTGAKICCVKDYNSVKICKDKLKFIDFMHANEFSEYIPKVYQTMVNGVVTKYKLSEEEKKKPYIFKFADSYAGKGYYVEHSIKNMDRSLLKNNPKKDYFVQEYIQGDEYCAHLFVVDGEIKAWLYYHQLDKSNPFSILKGGMSDYETVKDSEFIKANNEVFGKIIKALDFTGFCNFDYRIRDEQIYIFEINPRYGASFVRNHPDFAVMLEVVRNYYSNQNICYRIGLN
jgi:glutathione synthase/RimK-type ligase-like ATP-grasp enzyme